jgi:RNA polymerase sigma-70 factor (ECF subfamily)
MVPMQAPETLKALVERARKGERPAFEELAALYQKRLGSVVFFRLGAAVQRKAEVEDILQETFLRAVGSIGRFEWKGEESFFSWLRSIAEHVILEVARREKREPSLLVDSGLAREETSVSRVLRREERFERLKEALGGLSPDHRRVILLAKVERLPLKEVARRMERSADAVTNLLARALGKLKDRFGDTESLHLPDRLLSDLPPGAGGHAGPAQGPKN